MSKSANHHFAKICGLVAGMLLYIVPMTAQVQVGDYTKLNLNGSVAAGYSSSFSDLTSDHSVNVGGNANLSGSYFDPKFISFSFQPFYNRSQANSNYQSISDSSGIDGTVNFFGGSKTPGSISFNRTYNGTGEFGVPGTSSGLLTHGNDQQISIQWDALYQNLPKLSASYMFSNANQDVYGSDSSFSAGQRTFILRSNYDLDGFHLNGTYTHQGTDSQSSIFTTGEGTQSSQSSSNNYQFGAGHRLPLQGSWSAQYSHLNYNYEYGDLGQGSTGKANTVQSLVTLHPAAKVSWLADGEYTDNLIGGLEHAVADSTGQFALLNDNTSRGYRLGTEVYYTPVKVVGLSAYVRHQGQIILGKDYGVTLYGGNANFNYSRPFLGSFTFNTGLVDSANQEGNSSLGFVGNVGFSRKLFGWKLSSNFGYYQNVQTLLVIYTTSSMSYGASANRRLASGTYFNVGFSGGHSGVSQQAGTNSHTENYFSNLIWHRFTLTGNYTKSFGTSLYTTAGLVTLPNQLPSGIFSPDELATFTGNSYSFGVGTMLLHGLTLSGSYSKSRGAENLLTESYLTNNSMAHALLRYKFRKLYIDGGYTRLFQQATSMPGTQPVVSSYYIGISRWFNFF